KGLVNGLPPGDRALRLALDLAEHPDRPGGTAASTEELKVLIAKIRLTSSPGNWAERRIAVWLLGRLRLEGEQVRTVSSSLIKVLEDAWQDKATERRVSAHSAVIQTLGVVVCIMIGIAFVAL